MDEFIQWLNANWLTIGSIVLSGIISLIISAIYYYKGNRNNLQMTMLFPIVQLLKNPYSLENCKILWDISRSYCVRYLTKKERQVLMRLVVSYDEISKYEPINANICSLLSYFEYTLKHNGISIKSMPIEIQGDLVCYDYPPDYYYLSSDLRYVLEKYDEFEFVERQTAIISLFNAYCKEQFGADKRLEYFKDLTLKKVLEESEVEKNWNEKFAKMKEAKEQFCSLKIVNQLLILIEPENDQ